MTQTLPSRPTDSTTMTTVPNFKYDINTDWQFRRESTVPTPQTDPSAPDADWDTVCLPHTARMERYDETHPWQGICWYQKTFFLESDLTGKRVSVQFGAAMQIADVWVNGEHRTQHLGGYLPFSVDITAEAQMGLPITLLLRLDNRDTEIVPPGKPTDGLDFNYPGGLYRGVEIVVSGPLHITDSITANRVAGGGIFVTYDEVSEASAIVNVRTDVANDAPENARNCVVRQVLVAADGTAIASHDSEPVLISGHGHHQFVQAFRVANPRLWHPDQPHLYTLVTTVLKGQETAHEEITRIGIRTFAVGDRIAINGRGIWIAGTNRHQSHPYIESALSSNASRRDAVRIKNAGLNHVRLAHYPQDTAFIEACDELGILVQAPIPGWQILHDNPSFVRSSYQNIRDLIRRDRNHSSILFWEPNLNETEGDHLDWCRTAHEIAHEEYPGSQCFTFGDIYPAGWKPGWDIKHFVREYGDFGFGGNESTSRHTRGEGEAALLQQAWNFQWCHNRHWAQWTGPAPFYGDATWCMFDYNRGYYSRPCTCGMMDIFRLPKYTYYFFQSQRDPHPGRQDIESGPMVFIASDWTHREPSTKVVVFSNCDEVALFVNGRPVGQQTPDTGPDTHYSPLNANISATVGMEFDNSGGNPFDGGNARNLEHPPFTFFEVLYAPGEVSAIGYIAGKKAAEHLVRTPGEPSGFRLSFDTQGISLAADGADAVFVRAEVIDRRGTVVPLNSFPGLRLNVSGPGRLIGTEPLHIEAGVASVLLQSIHEPGLITVTAQGNGLPQTCATIESEASTHHSK